MYVCERHHNIIWHIFAESYDNYRQFWIRHVLTLRNFKWTTQSRPHGHFVCCHHQQNLFLLRHLPPNNNYQKTKTLNILVEPYDVFRMILDTSWFTLRNVIWMNETNITQSLRDGHSVRRHREPNLLDSAAMEGKVAPSSLHTNTTKLTRLAELWLLDSVSLSLSLLAPSSSLT